MIRLAIVGATGLVGSTILKVLEERKIKVDEYVLLASGKSKGKHIDFIGRQFIVEELNKYSFNDNRFDFALFCANGNISKIYAPIAAENGCIVIDNSSTFRMDKDVPLIVPEANAEMIKDHNGIIANPNCSTIQAILPLKVLHDNYKLKRVIYSTYQAVSGAGLKGIEDLEHTSKDYSLQKFSYPIQNNCLPHIDTFLDNGYTKEEIKMIEETRKILDIPDLNVTATTVRVPVKNCHCESINVELENEFDIDILKQQLNNSEGIVVLDNPEHLIYPIPSFVDGKDEVYIGRIRRDYSVKNGINMWVVADNIRKGAATNAVQILEKLLEKRLGN